MTRMTLQDGIRRAVERASTSQDESFAVYVDREPGGAVYVRTAAAIPPPNARLECIVQRWDDRTVQIRRNGAQSEWVPST